MRGQALLTVGAMLVGFGVHQLGVWQGKTIARAECEKEKQTQTVSIPNDCQYLDAYKVSVEEWIQAYEKQEDILLTCRGDLVRTQNELASDVICSSRTCPLQ